MAKHRKTISELERVAYHEAGHAVMAYVLRRRFHCITINPEKLDENAGGLFRLKHSRKLSQSVNFGSFGDSRGIVENQIRITLGGEVACWLFEGSTNWELSKSDIRACFSLAASQIYDDEEAGAYVNWLLLSVRNELNLPQNWARVCAVAKALIQQKALSYYKTREIIQNAKEEEIT